MHEFLQVFDSSDKYLVVLKLISVLLPNIYYICTLLVRENCTKMINFTSLAQNKFGTYFSSPHQCAVIFFFSPQPIYSHLATTPLMMSFTSQVFTIFSPGGKIKSFLILATFSLVCDCLNFCSNCINI